MSDKQPTEELRPLPDGGLKEAMPAWLKRPPAWRNMPTAEERFERTLPEPDTSEIDPSSLVDISDLPEWLQVVAARANEPEPMAETESGETAGYALGQLRAATSRVVEPEPDPQIAAPEPEEVPEDTEAEGESADDVENDVAVSETTPAEITTESREPSDEIKEEWAASRKRSYRLSLALFVGGLLLVLVAIGYYLIF